MNALWEDECNWSGGFFSKFGWMKGMCLEKLLLGQAIVLHSSGRSNRTRRQTGAAKKAALVVKRAQKLNKLERTEAESKRIQEQHELELKQKRI